MPTEISGPPIHPQPAPMFTQWGSATAVLQDGSHETFVVLSVDSHFGTNLYFFPLETIDDEIQEFEQAAREAKAAKTGLILPPRLSVADGKNGHVGP